MDYQIVATLGPASDTQPVWEEMLSAGVTGFRLNTSHLTLPQLQDWLRRLTPFLDTRTPRPPVVLDLQGSKWRLGQFPACELSPGQRVTLVHAPAASQPLVLPVPHADFFQAADRSGDELALNDAKVYLHCEARAADHLEAVVVQGGPLAARKGITYTRSAYRREALSAADAAVFTETHSLPGLRYALSYIRDAEDLRRYRVQLGAGAYLIAKLERQPALAEAAQMAEAADELWLCRGDLGAELGLKGMAEAAYTFSDQVPRLTRPALLAGQVLEHMAEHPMPTRSEISQIYTALRQGYGGVVLSDETAAGRYPVESCRSAALFKV